MSTVYIKKPCSGFAIRNGQVDWTKPYRLIPPDEFGLIDIDQNERGSIVFMCDGKGDEWAIADATDEIEIIYGDQQ